jgi:hypothetical protein
MNYVYHGGFRGPDAAQKRRISGEMRKNGSNQETGGDPKAALSGALFSAGWASAGEEDK